MPWLMGGLLGSEGWIRLGSLFYIILNFCILHFAFFFLQKRRGGGGKGVS